MNRPQGYTLIDVIAAVLFVFVILVVGALLFGNPFVELERQYDEVRLDGVRDLMEMMLEMEQEDPQVFWSLIKDVDNEAMMIGTAESCGGDYMADACGAQMDCLNLQTWSTIETYLSALPVDPNEELFSYEQSGYYMLYSDRVLEIGACSPQQQGTIRLMSFIK